MPDAKSPYINVVAVYAANRFSLLPEDEDEDRPTDVVIESSNDDPRHTVCVHTEMSLTVMTALMLILTAQTVYPERRTLRIKTFSV